MGMILRIASSRIVGQGDIVGRSGYFSLNLSANSVMRGRLDARRTLKSLVADLRIHNYVLYISIHAIFLDISTNITKNREQEMLFLCFLFFGKAFPYLKISLLASSANNTAVFTSAR